MSCQIDIKILHQHWVDTRQMDNPDDLCSHGEVYVRIGDKVVSSAADGSWTLSAAALYLMRTLKENYELGMYGSQLIPCCGHFFMADVDDAGHDMAVMVGCSRGIDWEVRHIEDGKIKHIAQSGEVGIIDKDEYRNLIIEFADKVEDFFKISKPKVIPSDEFDRRGYEAFWNEWRRLRREVNLMDMS